MEGFDVVIRLTKTMINSVLTRFLFVFDTSRLSFDSRSQLNFKPKHFERIGQHFCPVYPRKDTIFNFLIFRFFRSNIKVNKILSFNYEHIRTSIT